MQRVDRVRGCPSGGRGTEGAREGTASRGTGHGLAGHGPQRETGYLPERWANIPPLSPLGGIMAPAETGHQGHLEGAAVSAPVAILGACVGVAGLTGQRIEEVGGARSAVAEDDLTRPG